MINWQSETLKVLLVDDDDDDIFLTTTCLRNIQGLTFEIIIAKNYIDAVVRLADEKFDIAIFDYYLGAKTGIELYNEIKNTINIPVILLTGQMSYHTDLLALNSGIFDYLEKADLDSNKLSRSIRYSIEKYNMLLHLKRQEIHYRSIFENSSDGIIITDTKGNVLSINQKAKSCIPHYHPELSNIYDILSESNLHMRIQLLLNNYMSFKNEEWVIQNEDNTYYYSLAGEYLYIDTLLDFCQIVIHDITSHKKSQMMMALHEKQAVTQRFMRVLGHEIRNPLTNINLASNQLQEEMHSEDQISLLKLIDRNSRRIHDLLSALLQNSVISEISLQTIFLDAVIMTALANVQDRIRIKNIDIEISFNVKGIEIKGDAKKLEIALTNLLINATEAVYEKTGKIKVIVQLHNNFAYINIIDNGIGMSESQLKTIFDPYVSNKKDGLGLGLSATANILQGHHAQLSVESILGSGSTFTIKIPTLSTH